MVAIALTAQRRTGKQGKSQERVELSLRALQACHLAVEPGRSGRQNSRSPNALAFAALSRRAQEPVLVYLPKRIVRELNSGRLLAAAAFKAVSSSMPVTIRNAK